MANWFMKHGSKEVGPGTEDQLRSAFAKGKVTNDTMVRQEDSTEWMKFGVTGLRDQGDPITETKEKSVREKQREFQSEPVQTAGLSNFSMSGIRADMFRKKPTYNSPNPVVFASFVERFVALVIDLIILSICNFILTSIIFGGFFVSLFTGVAYFVVLQHQWGYTVGRKIMGMHVEMDSRDRPSLGVFGTRYLSQILSALILLVGFFIAFGDSKVRTLHDRLVGTFVVKE